MENKKCKGVKTSVVTREITFDDYKNCVLEGSEKRITQNVSRSRDHTVFTESLRKKALCANNDKQVILEDGINTLPIGHWRTKHSSLHDKVMNVKRLCKEGSLMNLAYKSIR